MRSCHPGSPLPLSSCSFHPPFPHISLPSPKPLLKYISIHNRCLSPPGVRPTLTPPVVSLRTLTISQHSTPFRSVIPRNVNHQPVLPHVPPQHTSTLTPPATIQNLPHICQSLQVAHAIPSKNAHQALHSQTSVTFMASRISQSL